MHIGMYRYISTCIMYLVPPYSSVTPHWASHVAPQAMWHRIGDP